MPQRLTVCLTVLIVISFTGPTYAQTNATWNGTNGNWTDATRWSTNPIFPNNGQPSAGDLYNAIVNGGTITLDQNCPVLAGVYTPREL
ncbi:MAG: hypothetical protein U0796_02600 [Gemmatales bacterium]